MAGLSLRQPIKAAKRIALLVLAIVAISACTDSIYGGTNIEASGDTVTVLLDVDTFDQVRATGFFSVTVEPGDTPSVMLTIDDNVEPYLNVRVEDGELIVALDDGVTVQGSATLQATVDASSLVGLATSGSSSLTAGSLTEPQMSLDSSGSSVLEVADIQASSIQVDASGNSRISFGGATEALEVDASGSAQVNVMLEAPSATVDASGSSRIELEAAVDVTGSLSGSSVLAVGDAETINVDTSGNAQVQESP